MLDAGDWLTLREASEATGVPAATIRKWARHNNIPSYLEKTPDGHLRIVSLTGIRQWADEIGREIESGEAPEKPATPATEPAPRVDPTPEESPETPSDSGEPDIPEGSMLVPLDAWNKMLNQLGNLHEAGQQLAEARERAAKAETEARFLKERLAEMRGELERTRGAGTSVEERGQTGAEPPDEPAQTESDPKTPVTLRRAAATTAKHLYQSWRRRKNR